MVCLLEYFFRFRSNSFSYYMSFFPSPSYFSIIKKKLKRGETILDVMVFPNRWTHFGYTFDKTTRVITFFVDGCMIKSEEISHSQPFRMHARTMQFGATADPSNRRGFVGDVAQSFLFSHALGQEEFEKATFGSSIFRPECWTFGVPQLFSSGLTSINVSNVRKTLHFA